MRPAHNPCAHPQHPFAHQHRGRRPHPRLDLRFDDVAFRRHLGTGFQFHDFSLQKNHLEQRVEAFLRRSRNFDGDRFAAPGFGTEPLFLQLLLHAVGIGSRQIAFVDGDDDRDLRRLGMIDRLDGLRHDPVVGGHDQYRDIRHVGATGTHLRKRLMAGRIQESDGLALRQRNHARADVLRDSTALVRHDIRLANRVQQRGLAVIDMPHHGDDRRSRLEVRGLFADFERLDLLGRSVDNPGSAFAFFQLEQKSVAFANLARDVLPDLFREVGEHTQLHQLLQ